MSFANSGLGLSAGNGFTVAMSRLPYVAARVVKSSSCFPVAIVSVCCRAMAGSSESPLDRLWKEYSAVYRDWYDLTLARWMAQTLGQLEGRVWRLSHPLLGAYRLTAQLAHDRQVWFKRFATPPPAYVESPCCRAPHLPLFTRDILETGLICQHCGDTCFPFDELPAELQLPVRAWADKYGPVHAVAHWDDAERKISGDYDNAFETAAKKAGKLLADAGAKVLPRFHDRHAAVIWEDQDGCLEGRPEEIEL